MPEAPFVIAGEPDRRPPPFLRSQHDRPPALDTPAVPTNRLKGLAESEDPAKGAEAIAAEEFANANPQFHEWAYQRPGAEARRAVFERQSARLARRLLGTAFSKTVPGGKEPAFKPSLYSTLQQVALCVLSLALLASALNVGANYAIATGAWSSLVDQPWTAYFFVLAAPAGGLAFALLVSQTLETDRAQKWFALIVAALALIAWTGWLLAFGRLYGLQSEIGDAGGRALPPKIMDEIRDLHAWMLLLQIAAEVLSGAAFKLLWGLLHWRNILAVVVPSSVMAYFEEKFDFLCDAEQQAARFVGRIDDYLEDYRKGLAGFTAACQAELHRVKNGARAAEAEARAKFLAAADAPAAFHTSEEVGS